MVKALGGLPTTWVALLLAGVGCRRWWRQRPRLAGFWVAMTASTAAWFLLAHNRTYPRYTLPLLALLVGPAVGGLDALLRSRLRTILVTSGATLVGAAWTLPATIAMTTTPFPPLRALAAANAAGPARGVVVDGGLSPFGDLLTLARRGQRPWCWRPLLAEGRVPLSMLTGPWLYVADEGTPSAFVPAPLQQRQRFACDEPRLHTLSQDRYLSCWVTGDGAIVLDPEWPQQNDQGGVLLGDEVRLLLQPTPLGSSFGAVLDVQGSAQLELDGGVQGRRSGVLGSGYHRGSHRVYAPLHRSGAAARLPTEVTLRRGGASSGTVVLERAWVDDPFGSHAPRQLNSSEQADGLDGLLDSDGFYSLERFGDADGRWAGERAWLSLPVGQGELTLRLLAPRPIPAQVTVAIESPPWQRHVEVGPQWTEVTLPIAVPQGRVKVILRVSNPFVPSRVIENSTDSRQLGVVLGSVSFEPAAR